MKGNKKEQIRQAAIAVIAREGFTRRPPIRSRRAGVAVGTIYNYFKNKEDILNHIFRSNMKKGRFLCPAAGAGYPSLEKIRAILTMHFAEVRRIRSWCG